MRSTSKAGEKRSTKASAKSSVTKSSGNVFADLGLPDAPEAFAKAELASRICAILEDEELTQVEAAKILGVDQPKVSALMRGRLEGFSSDRLLRFLLALGRDVEIVIRLRPRARGLGRLRVSDGGAGRVADRADSKRRS